MSDHENRRPAAGSDDETFARLQASDPAAAAGIDLAAVRRALDARLDTGIGRSDSDPENASSHVTPLPVGPAAPVRWVRIAAVAAVVALVGSGAFVVGRQSVGSDPGSAASAAAAGGTASEVGAAAVPPRTAASATPMPTAGGGSVSAETSMVDQKRIGFGRTHFNDGGLSAEGGAAQAWGFDPSAIVNAATAERVAAAMGVSGSASVQYGSWVVGPLDGSGPSVTLSGDSMASVSFNDPSAYPTCAPDTATGSDGAAEPCTPPTPADITGDDAIARADDVLSRIGVDLADYTLTSPDDQAGGGYRSVIGDRQVDGESTGTPLSVAFVGDRLASFNVGLAPAVSLGQYPVISPAAAVARMNDPRFGSTSSSGPIDIMRSDTPAPDAPTDSVAVPGAPVQGTPISWPIAEVTMTSATLGLAAQYQVDGSTLVVPTWELTADDGSTWSVVAVADDRLDFTG